MSGVAGAIAVFAMMYVMRGSFIALGNRGVLSPFLAAWSTNFLVAALGVFLLWFRARNRDIPSIKEVVRASIERVRAIHSSGG